MTVRPDDRPARTSGDDRSPARPPTETADFLGGLRPTRNKDVLRAQFVAAHAAFVDAASTVAPLALPDPSPELVDEACSAPQQLIGELRVRDDAVLERFNSSPSR